MNNFVETDYFKIFDLLSDEEKLVKSSIREFVTLNFIPIIEEHYRSGTFPIDVISKLGQLGIFGITLPEKYGGANLNNVAYGLAMQEL